jgi:hypothetical protein
MPTFSFSRRSLSRTKAASFPTLNGFTMISFASSKDTRLAVRAVRRHAQTELF